METKPTFIEKVSSFFRKKKIDADPTIPLEPQSQDDNSMAPEWFSIYGHGFHNGVYKIPKESDSFPAFLNSSNDLERTIELQNLNREELQRNAETLRVSEDDLKRCTQERNDSESRINTLSYKVEKVETTNKTIWSRNKQLSERRDHLSPEYGWIPALLFLAAGVMFILGDISVTEDIAYNGFDMPKGEGRLFAIGLAFTVFLIKPLLDRMFEKPFQKAGHHLQTVYKVVLLSVTTLGLVMLLLLGHFRSDAKLAKLEKAQYSSIIDSDSQPEASKVAARTQISTISNSLADNGWGRWGIILSTLIFAIGGAMCLAVAFPSLTQLANKYWFLPLRRWINKFFIRKNEKELNVFYQEINECKAKVNNATHRLTEIDLPSLKDLLARVKNDQIQLLHTYYQFRQSKENELYTDGFNRGQTYSLDGDLKFKIIDPMTFDNKNQSQAGGNSEADNETRKYTRRPFVKIRKMIADNYNKKQNHSTQDGTDFEILS